MTELRPPRALVLGSGGFLGRRVVEGSEGGYRPLRVTEIHDEGDLPGFEAEVEAVLQDDPQAALVNCIGIRTAPPDLMYLLNARIVRSLATVATRHRARLIHIGSAAEVVQRIQPSTGLTGNPAPVLTMYGETKRVGTQTCLAYEHGTVLRVYNLHGLPHQQDAGLHRLCAVVRAALAGERPLPSLVDTTRDYVHWQDVLSAVDGALERGTRGMVEVCSGVGISMSEIVEGLPRGVSDRLMQQLVPADLFAAVIGPSSGEGDAVERKRELLGVLRSEVLACASS